jgi:hypothetical protein
MLDDRNVRFEFRAVHQLRATVLQQAGRENADGKLQEFAEHVAETELRGPLGHVLQLAEFDCSLHQILESCKESMAQEL